MPRTMSQYTSFQNYLKKKVETEFKQRYAERPSLRNLTVTSVDVEETINCMSNLELIEHLDDYLRDQFEYHEDDVVG